MDNIEHIFFDLDRTIWDFEVNARDSLTELLHEFQLGERGVPSLELFHARYEYHNNRLWDLYRKNKISKGRLRSERFLRTFQDFKISDRSLSKRIGKRYLEICPNKCALVAFAIDTLEYLRSKNYRLHIISNGFQETQQLKLKNTGLDKYFDVVVTSEKARSKKPQLQIFQFSLNLAKATAESSLMLGDDLENDVLGALGAGMQAIHFNPLGRENEGVRSIKCLSEIREMF